MKYDSASHRAEELIDLQTKANAWFLQPMGKDQKGDLLERFKRIDAHEAGEPTTDEFEQAFHQAMAEVKDLFSGTAEARAIIEALGEIVRSSEHPLARRRIAAELLTEGSLDGPAAEVMMAALHDPDPQILIAGLRAAHRVPRDLALGSLEVMRRLRSHPHPDVSRIADIKTMQLDPALAR